LALIALSACASSTFNTDAGMDAGMDAGADAGTDADTDAGTDAGADAGTDAGVTERRIFVTSAARTADLGGIDGADALCASEASAAGLQGEFKAWLSTADSAVADRVVQSTVPYVRIDGARVADDWDDLTDGSILSLINRDANGMEHVADVWTGTLPSGLSYTETDCDGFTNGLVGAALCGTTQSINANWTSNQVPACDTPLRLFCIEQ
jgi:hypothetical protein